MRRGAGPVAGWGGGGTAVLDGWEAYDATTLTPKAPYQDVRVRNLTVTGTAVITSTTTSTGQFLGANGTKTVPSYSWTGDTDTGLYLAGANNPAMSAGDTKIQGWTTSGAFVAAGLALGFEGRAQFKSSADGKIEARAADGTTRLSQLDVGVGSAAAPAFSCGSTAGATGIYGAASDQLGVALFNADWYGFALDGFRARSNLLLGWSSSATLGIGASFDTSLGRSAAGVVGLYGASTSVGSSLALASDKVVKFSSTTDPDGTADVYLQRSNTAGWLQITTNGALSTFGKLAIAYGAANAPSLLLGQDPGAAGSEGIFGGNDCVGFALAGLSRAWAICYDGSTAAMLCPSDMPIHWSSTTTYNGTVDLSIARSAAGVLGIYGGTGTTTGGSVALASDKWVQWSSTTDPDGTYDAAVIRAAAGIVAPQAASAAAGDWKAPKSSLTTATMTRANDALVRHAIHVFTWTNAQVVALGAALTGDIKVCTLPAKTRVVNAFYVVSTQAAGTTTLTGSVGRTGATYIDYVVASDLKAAANTVYGDADAERGTNMAPTKAMELPSWTATTDVYMHFVATGANLDQVTGCTGAVYLETETYP